MPYRHDHWISMSDQNALEPFILSMTAGEMFQVRLPSYPSRIDIQVTFLSYTFHLHVFRRAGGREKNARYRFLASSMAFCITIILSLINWFRESIDRIELFLVFQWILFGTDFYWFNFFLSLLLLIPHGFESIDSCWCVFVRLQLMVTSLHNLETELSINIFNIALRLIAHQLDDFFIDSMIMNTKFSTGGASQFDFDMNRNLFALFGQYARRPDLLFKK